MHQDQLDNLALVTSGGARVDDQGFYAYGRLRRGFIGVERSFTGQQKDLNSGLIYMNARYYDPEIGQFLSPDTIVPDPSNLLDYNRYMFVRGNPMRYSDPSGYFSEDELEGWFGANWRDLFDGPLTDYLLNAQFGDLLVYGAGSAPSDNGWSVPCTRLDGVVYPRARH
jgi:RHS repeat-associated protein